MLYKFEGYFEGTEEDADAMQNFLATSIAVDLEIPNVFRISVNAEREQSETHTNINL